jgi:hypothetical protein
MIEMNLIILTIISVTTITFKHLSLKLLPCWFFKNTFKASNIKGNILKTGISFRGACLKHVHFRLICRRRKEVRARDGNWMPRIISTVGTRIELSSSRKRGKGSGSKTYKVREKPSSRHPRLVDMLLYLFTTPHGMNWLVGKAFHLVAFSW